MAHSLTGRRANECDATLLRTSSESPDWQSTLARRVQVTDLLVLFWVVFGTQLAWVGVDGDAVSLKGSPDLVVLGYWVISVAVIVAWMLALHLFDSRSYRVLGSGSHEYRAVVRAAVQLFGLVAIVAFVFRLDIARGYILIAFPLGTLMLLASRWIWRQWLGAARRAGGCTSKVLLVGSVDSATEIAKVLIRVPEAGYEVVGACIEGGERSVLPGTTVPVLAGVGRSLETLRDLGADTLVVTSADDLGPAAVRRISWGLIPSAEHLVVAPSLMDVGGPRIRTRPVAGLPLIHVETPSFGSGKLLAKRTFDLLVGGIVTVLALPLLSVVAVLVRASGPGPVLFMQERIGRNGKPFRMLKFRSMVVDAETRIGEVRGAQDAGNGVLFKRRADPRVTPLGRWMRRFSVDELPQLFNVLGGSMSLVGPRPPLPAEVELYADHVHRRFLAKPGLTGLWQVSGRSTLDWEDSVRLDLYYVENWSLTGDVILLWRTARAVLWGRGAW